MGRGVTASEISADYQARHRFPAESSWRTAAEQVRPTMDERTVMPGISKSTLIRGGAIGAAVAGGAQAGPLLLAPAASVAQDPTSSPEASAETTTPGTPESPETTPSPGTTEPPIPDDDELCDHFWHG